MGLVSVICERYELLEVTGRESCFAEAVSVREKAFTFEARSFGVPQDDDSGGFERINRCD